MEKSKNRVHELAVVGTPKWKNQKWGVESKKISNIQPIKLNFDANKKFEKFLLSIYLPFMYNILDYKFST